MDFFTFMASSAALATTMARCAEAGLQHDGKPSEILPVLRHIGLEGEQRMWEATKNVNTQKGLLFSLGIVAAAAGWLIVRQSYSFDGLFSTVADITKGIVQRELVAKIGKNSCLSAGERLFQLYGVTGIRGEIEAGLPSVRNKALPCLKETLERGTSINDALLQTLLTLMECIEDTNVMHRHNPEKLHGWLRSHVRDILSSGGVHSAAGHAKIAAFSAECITDHVSPGGAADLLAVTWFIHRMEEVF
jgi:holo-ACP synthase/triphosphoribosyl-dephospho-CoA synthase